MLTIGWRRGAVTCAMTVLALLAAANSAIAAPAPLRADVRVGGPIDIAAFEQFVALRYHIQVRKIVAADIDRDGDVDVVAATDRGFMVWVNDGRGHLTSLPPAHRSSVDGTPGGTASQSDSTVVQEPIQDDLRPALSSGSTAHAPPTFGSTDRFIPHTSGVHDRHVGCRTPRAPPA